MVELYNGDCLDIMMSMPDESVDMVLCDLPYGCTAQEWDKIIKFDELWKQYERIRKENCPVVLFSSQPFTTLLISSNMSNFKYCWYWSKNQTTNFFHAKRMPLRKIEEICVFYKNEYNPQKTDGHIPTCSAKGCSNGKIYYGGNKRNYEGGDTTRFPNNLLEFDCVDNYHKKHPNEKPVELLEYLIKTYTDEGDTVLDNTMGSGSTGVACVNTNRNFIGIELDKSYFEIATKRINEVKDRITLW
jgi:site-specific DNA-methyltransferase (adenine-specific)